jgi:hypothetical protein
MTMDAPSTSELRRPHRPKRAEADGTGIGFSSPPLKRRSGSFRPPFAENNSPPAHNSNRLGTRPGSQVYDRQPQTCPQRLMQGRSCIAVCPLWLPSYQKINTPTPGVGCMSGSRHSHKRSYKLRGRQNRLADAQKQGVFRHRSTRKPFIISGWFHPFWGFSTRISRDRSLKNWSHVSHKFGSKSHDCNRKLQSRGA